MIKMKMTKAIKLKHAFKPIVKQTILACAIKESGYTFSHTEHIKLWDWLANNPSKEKRDYFDEEYKGNVCPANYCFACEFANKVTNFIEQRYGKDVVEYITSDVLYEGCFACPFDCNCEDAGCLDGIYDEWDEAEEYIGTWEDVYEYRGDRAEIIRDFPIRIDVEIPLN